MANFPGVKAYPLLATGPTALVDAVTRTMHLWTSIPRGGTTIDFNANLRGLHRRIDRRPRPPYPP